MAKNDNPHMLRFLDSMARHGGKEAGEAFAAEHPLEESAGPGDTFEWAGQLCGFLNGRYSDETVKAIRMDCACGPEYGKEKLREIRQEEKDPYAFAEKVNRLDLGFSLEYDGASYSMIYPQCYCPCVNQSDEPLPRAWCYCTAGYNKRLFEGVFGREVRAELISSVKQGDADCRIRITVQEAAGQAAHRNFLFDLDQTLLDFHATEQKALGIVLQANGLPFSDEIYRAFKAHNKSLWLQLERGEITRTELFSRRFEAVISLCGGDPSRIDPLKVNEEFIRTMSVNGIPMDGAMEFIRKLRAGIPGARIYIVTNGVTLNAMGRIASTGLDRYLDGVFVSEDLKVAKPAREYFERCLERIGEPKESCIVIGDSLTSDMLGAQNASLKSVWFMPAGETESAVKEYDIDYCAADFGELYGILEKWAADPATPGEG